MSKKQSQQPLPAGMHIESGWSDIKRFEEEKKKQQQDPRHNQE